VASRAGLTVGALLLAVASAIHLGQGAYIYAKAQLAQVLLERAWQRALAGEAAPKPWPWADTWPVARLEAPALGVDLFVCARPAP
jgi:sortase A